MEYVINSKVDVSSIENEHIGSSLLQDFDEAYIYISIPIDKGMQKRLEAGRKIKLIYYEENRLYYFDSIVDGSKMDNILLYRVPRPKDYKTEIVQRREDIRFSIVLNVYYMKIDINKLDDLNVMVMNEIEEHFERFEHSFKKCVSVDLSGQGIGLISADNLKEGDHILVLIEHPLLKEALKGQVICKEKLYKGKGQRCRVGVRFLDLKFNTKEKIIHFIFEKMREQLEIRKE